jgi:hypothetical protein
VKRLLVKPSLFLAFPLLISCGAAFVSFDLPHGYLYGWFFLILVALLILGIDIMLPIRLPLRIELQQVRFSGHRESITAILFSWAILAACLVDITLFPIPIFTDPSLYATFEESRGHVRHISNMCWILPVVAMLCVRNRMVRAVFIVAGLLFPVVVLDRNRLFASIYSLMAVLIIRSTRTINWKHLAVVGLAAVMVFAQLGKLRSGNLEWLSLPLSPTFRNSPPGMKWVLLYMSAGVYNFSSIWSKGYSDASLLICQLLPGSGSVESLYGMIPLDMPTINVGTEYFPFLMAFGPAGVLLAALLLFSVLCLSIVLLRSRPTLFSLLIFLRVSYVCIMSGFSTQAFTWTTFGFILVCLFMMGFSSLLYYTSSRQSHLA